MFISILFPLLLAWVAFSGSVMAGETRELMLAVYSVPKEAYERTIIPAFQRSWKQRTGQDVRIRSSYGASGAQASLNNSRLWQEKKPSRLHTVL